MSAVGNKTVNFELIGEQDMFRKLRALAPMAAGLKGAPRNIIRNAARDMAKVTLRDVQAMQAQTYMDKSTRRGKATANNPLLKNSFKFSLLSTRYRDMAILQGNSKEFFYIGFLRDAFHGVFVNQGTVRGISEQAFLQKGMERAGPEAQRVFISRVGVQLERLAKMLGKQGLLP